jgi:hypothetical protein
LKIEDFVYNQKLEWLDFLIILKLALKGERNLVPYLVKQAIHEHFNIDFDGGLKQVYKLIFDYYENNGKECDQGFYFHYLWLLSAAVTESPIDIPMNILAKQSLLPVQKLILQKLYIILTKLGA